jgi:predicted Zn-dependent protease
MKQTTTTLLVYFFLLTYFPNNLFSAVSLYEKSILNLGKSFEEKGDYEKALNVYEKYNRDFPGNREIERAIVKLKVKAKNSNPEPQRVTRKQSSSSRTFYAIQTLTTSKSYRKAAEREKNRIENMGLKCYLREGRYLYLRCNPSTSRSALREGQNILRRFGVDYFVVRDKSVPSEFFLGGGSTPQENPVTRNPREERPALTRNPQEERPAITRNPREERPALTRNPREELQNREVNGNTNSQPPQLHLLKGGRSKHSIADGYKALNAKKLSTAKEIFSDILKYSPQDIDASFGYALAFMNEGDWLKAYVTLNPIVALAKDRDDIQKTFQSIIYNMNLKKGWKNVSSDPDKSIAFFKKAGEVEMTADVSEGLAYAFTNAKDFDSAIPEAKKIFDKKRDFKSANLLIDAYLKAKREPEAEAFFNSLEPNFQANLEYNPKREKLLKEVENLINEQHYHQAKSLLRELYLMFPTNQKVLLYFAEVYRGEKKYSSAIEYYKTVLSRDETNKNVILGLSKVYIATEKYGDALQLLQKLKGDSPEIKTLTNSTKLKMYMQENNKREAMNLAKSMLLDDPTNVELYKILGDLNMEGNNIRDAYFYYGRAFQLDPENFGTRIKLLNLLLEQNLFDQIQTLLGKFQGFKFSPEQRTQLRDFYIKFYKKYTAVSLEEKDYVYALKGAKSGLQMEPEDTFFIESAGWAGLNSKRYNDAIFYFNKMIVKEPKNYTIMYGLGLAYVNLKQFVKAKNYFKMAERSSDIDLLYKVAEIYKDIGFKKDSYRVIKLIEELGKRDIGIQKSANSGGNSPTQFTAMPISQEISQKDNLNTFNPFLAGNIATSPPPIMEIPKTQTIYNSVPQVVPEPETLEIKKKRVNEGFFSW